VNNIYWACFGALVGFLPQLMFYLLWKEKHHDNASRD
jgi:hypothetical protein